jgi:hypothetical protein
MNKADKIRTIFQVAEISQKSEAYFEERESRRAIEKNLIWMLASGILVFSRETPTVLFLYSCNAKWFTHPFFRHLPIQPISDTTKPFPSFGAHQHL